ncbi:hypothetical protein Ciccas_011214 [Cichlidogyrus casuarinus]|uniref:MD-2-related lipid-recognition domain-containing protein n=1 Tax=Cichlidogyrus casuarinus TaxID=1844966 RepID=A0ABD2PSJ5_9PLAT
MFAKLVLVASVVCWLCLCADASVFKDCGSKLSKVSSVVVNPCPSEPCPLIVNHNSTVSITFTPSQDIVGGSARVHGVIAHVSVPFSLPDTTLCPHITPSGCPLKSGQQQTYTFTIPISSTYPRVKTIFSINTLQISVIIRWELVDQNGQDIVCIDFPAKIVSQYYRSRSLE